MADLDGDGKEDTPEQDMDITRNRRRMAWYFIVAFTVLTGFLLFGVLPPNLVLYDSLYQTFAFVAASVVLAYMGTSAVMTYWQNRK